MKATLPSGELVPIPDCYIAIPALLDEPIPMKIMPDISDSKSASYSNENAIGRSFPFTNFSNSENRTISWTAHFMVCVESDPEEIIGYMRAFEACTYPITQDTSGASYNPPPICKLRCGQLLASEDDVCAVMKSYNVKFDPSVPMVEDSYIPYKLDIDLQFDVVHDQANLPGAHQIMDLGN